MVMMFVGWLWLVTMVILYLLDAARNTQKLVPFSKGIWFFLAYASFSTKKMVIGVDYLAWNWICISPFFQMVSQVIWYINEIFFFVLSVNCRLILIHIYLDNIKICVQICMKTNSYMQICICKFIFYTNLYISICKLYEFIYKVVLIYNWQTKQKNSLTKKRDSSLSSGLQECVCLVPNKLRNGLVWFYLCTS